MPKELTKNEISEFRKLKDWVSKCPVEATMKIQKLEQSVKRKEQAFLDAVDEMGKYAKALEFYATRDNYKLEHFDPNLNDYMSTVDYDEGEIARKVLEESE